jgi:hypothetical protein
VRRGGVTDRRRDECEDRLRSELERGGANKLARPWRVICWIGGRAGNGPLDALLLRTVLDNNGRPYLPEQAEVAGDAIQVLTASARCVALEPVTRSDSNLALDIGSQ